MLRVKDGILFVSQWLENMSRLVDEIVVVDNGSTDGTLEILRSHPKVVSVDRTEGYDEGRDKILAYQRARERKPDWVLWLDVDEIFEQRLTRQNLDKLMASRYVTRYFFRRFHMIDEQRFNASSTWLRITCWPDRVMWREQPSAYFNNVAFNNGLICGVQGIAVPTRFRMKHLGYVSKLLVESKIDLYRSIDPTMENTYQKMRQVNPVPWVWHEYTAAPSWVTVQNLLLNLYFAYSYFSVLTKRLWSRLSKLANAISRQLSSVSRSNQ